MTDPLRGLPASVLEKKKKEILRRLNLGVETMETLGLFEKDLVYMGEVTAEALTYWTEQKQMAVEANDNARIMHTDAQRRQVLLRLYKAQPSDTDNPCLALIDKIREAADALPRVH